MTNKQERLNLITRTLLDNEICLYNKRVTSFYKIRKYVKKEKLNI